MDDATPPATVVAGIALIVSPSPRCCDGAQWFDTVIVRHPATPQQASPAIFGIPIPVFRKVRRILL